MRGRQIGFSLVKKRREKSGSEIAKITSYIFSCNLNERRRELDSEASIPEAKNPAISGR